MNSEHWMAMGFTAFFLYFILLITLRLRPGSRAYRLFGRGLLCVSGVAMGSLWGLWGVNLITLGTSLCFGTPGIAALVCLKTLF